MKKTKLLILLLVSGVTLAGLNSCSKTIAGPNPADAETTTPPATQATLASGSVFVDAFNLTNNGWIPDANSSRHYDEYFSKITPDIVSSGQVLIFFTPGGPSGNQWVSMPSSVDGGAGYSMNYTFETTVGKATLHFSLAATSCDGTAPSMDSYIIAGSQFKVIAVPSTVVTSMKQAGVDMNCYDQVSHYLSL
jgi:hypothetical protein